MAWCALPANRSGSPAPSRVPTAAAHGPCDAPCLLVAPAMPVWPGGGVGMQGRHCPAPAPDRGRRRLPPFADKLAQTKLREREIKEASKMERDKQKQEKEEVGCRGTGQPGCLQAAGDGRGPAGPRTPPPPTHTHTHTAVLHLQHWSAPAAPQGRLAAAAVYRMDRAHSHQDSKRTAKDERKVGGGGGHSTQLPPPQGSGAAVPGDRVLAALILLRCAALACDVVSLLAAGGPASEGALPALPGCSKTSWSSTTPRWRPAPASTASPTARSATRWTTATSSSPGTRSRARRRGWCSRRGLGCLGGRGGGGEGRSQPTRPALRAASAGCYTCWARG